MTTLSVKKLKDALKRKDAPLFSGELNLNIIGIRSADTQANTFNDVLAVLYQVDGKWKTEFFPCTTDPGTYYREHAINAKGTAILKPGHYRSCWQIGAHRGQYKALVQRGLMTVYRDNNADKNMDLQDEESGYFGINLHRASRNGYTLQVDRWSAGCQVLANMDDFKRLMELVNLSAKKYGSRFSYTLLDEDDLT